MNDHPLLSVCLITYNHVKYIKEAIDGVLMQKVNFSWELIIADDFSTDGTREILLDYQAKYPGVIKLILQNKNIGPSQNWMELITSPQSKYIAYFEGDDYWTDPFKLQKQVDFLENNPEYSACFHNVNILYEDQNRSTCPFYLKPVKNIFVLEDLVSHNNIPTCSMMFRNQLPNPFPEWFHRMPMGDWPLQILLAEHGNFRYLDEILGVYRVHEKGSWLSQDPVRICEKSIQAAEVINRYLDYKFDENIKRSISFWHYEIAFIRHETGNMKDVLCQIRKHIYYAPHWSDINRAGIIKIIFRHCARNASLGFRRIYNSILKG